MANRKSMETINSIKTLSAAGHSARRIAKLLGINRKTVDRLLQKGPNPTLGSDNENLIAEQMGPNLTPGSETCPGPEPSPAEKVQAKLQRPGPQSLALPYLDLILEKLEAGQSATSIYYDLKRLYGFPGSYPSLKRMVRRLRKITPEWVPRLEHPLGEAAQVDFGELRVLNDGTGGRNRKAHIFVMTLCGSRKAYVEAVPDQKIETFIQCHIRAFAFFGGVPLTVIPDNLKQAVLKACWEDPVLNRTYSAFAKHCGFAVLPCHAYSPQEKGIVESGVKYVKGYLKGRTFLSLDAMNAWLCEWEQNVAGTRIHGTTKRQVNEAFIEEQKCLQSLPSEAFDLFRSETRVVHPDGFVQIGARFYEVPPAYLNKTLIVHLHANVVRIFDGEVQVVMHARSSGRGARVRGTWAPPREVPRAQSELEEWVRRDALLVGANMQSYITTAIEAKGRIVYRVLQGVLKLRRKYEQDVLEYVAAELLAKHCFDGKVFRRRCEEQVAVLRPDLTQEHEILRSLREYCIELLDDSLTTNGANQ